MRVPNNYNCIQLKTKLENSKILDFELKEATNMTNSF